MSRLPLNPTTHIVRLYLPERRMRMRCHERDLNEIWCVGVGTVDIDAIDQWNTIFDVVLTLALSIQFCTLLRLFLQEYVNQLYPYAAPSPHTHCNPISMLDVRHSVCGSPQCDRIYTPPDPYRIDISHYNHHHNDTNSSHYPEGHGLRDRWRPY